MRKPHLIFHQKRFDECEKQLNMVSFHPSYGFRVKSLLIRCIYESYSKHPHFSTKKRLQKELDKFVLYLKRQKKLAYSKKKQLHQIHRLY